MPIESISPDKAQSSPHYLKNKDICDNWEGFTLKNGGSIEGNFNSWAIYFHGEIPSLKTTFQIQKSDIKRGSVLSPVNKTVEKESIILFSNVTANKESFIVRKKSILDKIGLSSYKEVNAHYSTNSKGKTPEIEALLDYLQEYLDQKSLKEFFYNKSTKQLQFTFNHLIENPLIVEELSDLLD